jgi:hypothetical protein
MPGLRTSARGVLVRHERGRAVVAPRSGILVPHRSDELRRQRPEAADKDAFDRTPWESGCCDEWATVVIGLAGVLRHYNYSFDRSRFFAACGFES